MTNPFKLTLIALMMASGFAQATPINLIQNGDFQSSTNVPTSGFINVTSIPSWTVGGNVDLIQGAYGAISGISVDLLGSSGPDSISQSFVTIVGHSYLLMFDLSRNGSGARGDSTRAVDVSFNDVATRFENVTNPLSFDHDSLAYIATSTLTTLKFSSLTNGASGAVLDNVVVTDVPEPAPLALLGLGLVGLAASRRKSAK